MARLLGKVNYSLRSDRKYVESCSKNPPSKDDRNQQFEIIQQLREEYTLGGHAVISIDTKKRELIGNFKNDGTTYEEDPDDVLDHDFLSDAEGVAIPYGVYDITRNHGSVYVGTNFDTGKFAADNIKRWWLDVGRRYYDQDQPKLLILADCGGSNGARLRLWKRSLERVLCDELGLHVRVCHYPPGTSKYNPIEHRLFSEISKNWAGQPLRTYRTLLNYLRTTTTQTGLKVRAKLITKIYRKGIKIKDKEFKQLRFEPSKILPKWNYSIIPNNQIM